MILGPNEQALIRDETKGEISCYLGPNKTSLAGTDQPVIFDEKIKRFKQVGLETAITTLKTAPEGYYIVLKNPAREGEKNMHPGGQGKLTTPDLRIGKKINIPGPASFALWPGQMAKVLPGHILKSNEYLIVRIYDELAARENWKNAVVKNAVSSSSDDAGTAEQTITKKGSKSKATEQQAVANIDIVDSAQLVMGQSIIIRGTDVAFYIPPTGVEVVAEQLKDGIVRHVRTAVTLERLEYAILLDENGNKRYEHGPKVVFPRPTEHFVEQPIKSDPEKAKAKKFRAVELDEASGIFVKVTAPYTEESGPAAGTERVEGEELFITGKQQMIYYPRDEHATIKYGSQEVHFGIAIPKGEAKYVLDKKTGETRLEQGPRIFLPDPRRETLIKRILSEHLCSLMYPGNTEAILFNRNLAENSSEDFFGAGGAENVLSKGDQQYTNFTGGSSAAAIATPDMEKKIAIRGASKTLAGDAFDRKNKFRAPTAVVINEKFTGAVAMNVYNGYAIMLVSKTGSKRVVQGPKLAILEYDESPQILHMSKGRPKGSKGVLETVYLKTTNNHVGDKIEVETSDLVRIELDMTYRVNFTGEPEKWFDVDDYIKFLCDNVRSRVRNKVRKMSVREFHDSADQLLRDIILGASASDGSKRKGMLFEENGLHVYDVEILNVNILDTSVSGLLAKVRRSELEQSIQLEKDQKDLEFNRISEDNKRMSLLAKETKDLEFVKASESIKRQSKTELAETDAKFIELQVTQLANRLVLDMSISTSDIEKQKLTSTLEEARANTLTTLKLKELDRDKTAKDLALAFEQKKHAMELEKLEADVKSTVARGQAFSPGLVAALQNLADSVTIEKIASALGPLEVMGIKPNEGGIFQAFGTMLQGSPLGQRLLQSGEINKNGSKASSASPRT